MKNFNAFQSTGKRIDLRQLKENQIEIDSIAYLDGATVQQLFNISASTLYRMRKNDRIPYTQFGRLYLYPCRSLPKACTTP